MIVFMRKYLLGKLFFNDEVDYSYCNCLAKYYWIFRDCKLFQMIGIDGQTLLLRMKLTILFDNNPLLGKKNLHCT